MLKLSQLLNLIFNHEEGQIIIIIGRELLSELPFVSVSSSCTLHNPDTVRDIFTKTDTNI